MILPRYISSLTAKMLSISILLFSYHSCGDKSALSENVALSSVESYLMANPVFETTELEIGEVKFKARDKQKLEAYKTLASKGYLELALSSQKKKFLSKDSVFTYLVTLTNKASSFVVQQKDRKISVKTAEYILEEGNKGQLELSSKNSGKITVNLKRIDTDFAILVFNKNTYAPFSSKTFKLKYNKDKGWQAVNVK